MANATEIRNTTTTTTTTGGVLQVTVPVGLAALVSAALAVVVLLVLHASTRTLMAWCQHKRAHSLRPKVLVDQAVAQLTRTKDKLAREVAQREYIAADEDLRNLRECLADLMDKLEDAGLDRQQTAEEYAAQRNISLDLQLPDEAEGSDDLALVETQVDDTKRDFQDRIDGVAKDPPLDSIAKLRELEQDAVAKRCYRGAGLAHHTASSCLTEYFTKRRQQAKEAYENRLLEFPTEAEKKRYRERYVVKLEKLLQEARQYDHQEQQRIIKTMVALGADVPDLEAANNNPEVLTTTETSTS